MMCSYGFRIVGDCTSPRRLVDAGKAFLAHAACDDRCQPDRECYLSAFHFGDDFGEHLEAVGSTKGYRGICWSSFIWFDIDATDLEDALQSVRQLLVALADWYEFAEGDLLVFFSGSKGFHVGVPTGAWKPSASKDFNRVAKHFALRVADRAQVKIDAGIYDKVRAFRAPNSRHPKTGLYKRQLDVGAVLEWSLDAIRKAATTPAAFEVPRNLPPSGAAATDWREAQQEIQAAANVTRERREQADATLNRATLEFIRAGASNGDRHRLTFSSAANLAEFGCPPRLAHALLSEAALDCGLSPGDVRRQIDCGLDHAGNGKVA